MQCDREDDRDRDDRDRIVPWSPRPELGCGCRCRGCSDPASVFDAQINGPTARITRSSSADAICSTPTRQSLSISPAPVTLRRPGDGSTHFTVPTRLPLASITGIPAQISRSSNAVWVELRRITRLSARRGGPGAGPPGNVAVMRGPGQAGSPADAVRSRRQPLRCWSSRLPPATRQQVPDRRRLR